MIKLILIPLFIATSSILYSQDSSSHLEDHLRNDKLSLPKDVKQQLKKLMTLHKSILELNQEKKEAKSKIKESIEVINKIKLEAIQAELFLCKFNFNQLLTEKDQKKQKQIIQNIKEGLDLIKHRYRDLD